MEHYILSVIKEFSPKTKFYFAASSEMFGKVRDHLKMNLYPRSSYGISKVASAGITYKIFACSGILFNHESPRRGFEFVTRKISFAVAKIKLGMQKNLFLGNINSKRDWGHAQDYIKAMWLMLQNKHPKDFVVGTGKTHSVKQFVEIAFKHVGLNYKKYLKINKKLFRPAEVDLLKADFSKAKKELKWQPQISFKKLVTNMVDSDLNFVRKNYKNE